MNKILVSFLLIICAIQACRKDKVGFRTDAYILEIPSHFPEMIIPLDNPMTVQGVNLGRRLFYDVSLSKDNSISCGSCHSPATAFSDEKQFSLGVNGTVGTRNSMALMNLGWQKSFFWDGRSGTLEEQILEPVPNPIEMHQSWVATVGKLKAETSYRNQFYQTFGVSDFDSTHVVKAIAQFLRTMISGNSKFDVIYKKQNNLALTDAEKKLWSKVSQAELSGYDLFKSLNGADCFHCHNGPLMQVHKFSNNGLDAVFADLGRGNVTKNANDNGKFKVPTLRNIALSAPYMHDGRFKTLDDVITHYSTEIKKSTTIDPLIEFANQGGVQLDEEQRFFLKSFLITLTDSSFVTNPDFQPLNQ